MHSKTAHRANARNPALHCIDGFWCFVFLQVHGLMEVRDKVYHGKITHESNSEDDEEDYDEEGESGQVRVRVSSPSSHLL